MLRGRLGTQMPSCSFRHTWNRRHQFPSPGCAGLHSHRGNCATVHRRKKRTCIAAGGIAPSGADYRCNASTETGKRGNEKAPTPKDAARKSFHNCERRYQKTEAHKNIDDSLLNARLDLPAAILAATRARARLTRLRCLRQLAAQRMRYKANVRATGATETGPKTYPS